MKKIKVSQVSQQQIIYNIDSFEQIIYYREIFKDLS